MKSLCCVGCSGGGILTLAAPLHTITDVDGRPWLFENHPRFGPIVLRKDGNPKARQPGSRSKFWPAWEAWRNQQANINA